MRRADPADVCLVPHLQRPPFEVPSELPRWRAPMRRRRRLESFAAAIRPGRSLRPRCLILNRSVDRILGHRPRRARVPLNR